MEMISEEGFVYFFGKTAEKKVVNVFAHTVSTVAFSRAQSR